MRRFFTEEKCSGNEIISLSDSDSTHIIKVLRQKEGDEIIVCDGFGNEFDAVIDKISNGIVSVHLSDGRKPVSESAYNITLIQCLPKSGKMELIIQKCVELGVFSIIPVTSKRTVVTVDNEKKASAKTERYNKISYEAAKQSQRGIVPKVFPITTLATVNYASFDVVIVPYEEETSLSLKQLFYSNEFLKTPCNIALVIGPEGGFAPEEVTAIIDKGGFSVTLGKRILRTETAGMAALAMLMCLLED